MDSLKIQKMELCVPECQTGRANVNIPMIPCGLCEGWFHLRCLGLPEGDGPRCIRGLYFCQSCLKELRALRQMAQPLHQKEIRWEAMEASVEALDVEQALLKELLKRAPLSVSLEDVVVRVGGRLVDSAHASLLRENASLKRQLANRVLAPMPNEVAQKLQPASHITFPSSEVLKSTQKNVCLREFPVENVKIDEQPKDDNSKNAVAESHVARRSGRKQLGERSLNDEGSLDKLPYRFLCTLCQHKFVEIDELNEHQNVQHDGKGSFRAIESVASDVATDHSLPSVAPTLHTRSSGELPGQVDAKVDQVRDRGFLCSHCGQTFLTKGIRLHHIRIKHPLEYRTTVTAFACSKCGRKYEHEVSLSKHELFCCRNLNSPSTTSGEKVEPKEHRKANVSVAKSSRRLSLPNVTRPEVVPSKSYQCHVCGKAFSRWNRLSEHLKNQHQLKAKYACSVCRQQFDLLRPLRAHLKVKHNGKGRVRKLFVKTQSSASSTNLVAAAQSNTTPSAVDLQPISSQSIRRSAVKSKEIRCLYCTKIFATNETRSIHIKSSHPAAKFGVLACHQCGISYGNISSLKRHNREKHPKRTETVASQPNTKSELVSRGMKLYKCQLCKFVVHTWNKMTRHLRDSHGVRQVYSCSHCKRQSDTINEMREHVKIHPNGSVRKLFVPLMPSASTAASRVSGRLKAKSGAVKDIQAAKIASQNRSRFKGRNQPKRDLTKKQSNSDVSGTNSVDSTSSKSRPTCSAKSKVIRKARRPDVRSKSNSKAKPAAKCLGSEVCHLCQASFEKNSLLTLHMFSVHKIDVVNLCVVCGKMFGSPGDIRIHQIELHGKFSGASYKFLSVPSTDYVQCRLCSKFFVGKRVLLSHLRRSHKLDSSKIDLSMFGCSDCGCQFQTITATNKHKVEECSVGSQSNNVQSEVLSTMDTGSLVVENVANDDSDEDSFEWEMEDNESRELSDELNPNKVEDNCGVVVNGESDGSDNGASSTKSIGESSISIKTEDDSWESADTV